MKVLEIIPAQFNVGVAIYGEFVEVEHLNGNYVIYGYPDKNVRQYLWFAATGSQLPKNYLEYLQTLRWYVAAGTDQRVAHVLETDGLPLGPSPTTIFRVRTLNEEFSITLDHEFVSLLENADGSFDVWFYTQGIAQSKQFYQVLPIDSVPQAQVIEYAHKYYAVVAKPDGAASRKQPIFGNLVPEAVPNGMVFNYRRSDGSERLVRCSHIEFGTNSKGVQTITAWDLDRKDWRTFWLEAIVDFPKVQV